MVVKPPIRVHGFEIGDMVWAKMKNQPWWPGHVYNEEFATPLVRQSKREGLLLIAFFGASSYGWFESSEIIPFDFSYAEKSHQTDSRAFVRAVEDAIREVSRRICLSLCCVCRNKQNFRKIDVQGCESGGVCSIDAIGKARVSFQPELTVDFLRQLALEPTVSEHVDIEFIKNKATVMAYRKAVYEDFDQVFDYDPVHASVRGPAPREMSSKAPLSGREVFADSLTKVKNTAHFKDHAKKDEAKEIKKENPFEDPAIAAGEFTLKDATGSLEVTPPTVSECNNPCFEMSTSIVESPTSSSVAEVNQAKSRFTTSKETGQVEGPQSSDGNYETELSRVLGDLLSLAVDPFSTVNRGSHIKGRKALLRFRSLVFQEGQNISLPQASDEPNSSKSSEDSVEVPTVKPQVGLKRGPSVRQEEMAAAKRKKVCDIRNLAKEKKVTKKIDEPAARDVKQQVPMTFKKAGPEFIKKTEQLVPEPTILIMKFPHGGSLPSVSELKARFACFGPMDHSATQIFRNTFSCRVVFRHTAHAEAAYRFVGGTGSLFGNTDVKCILKEVGDVGAAKPEPPVNVTEDHRQPSMEDRPLSVVPATSDLQLKSIPKISGGEEIAGNGDSEVFADGFGLAMNTAKLEDRAKKEETDLSRVWSDLHSLAVDPFNTVNKGSRIKGKKAFLRFRSLVFQKGQNFSLPLAGGEPNASKSSEGSVEVPPVKPQGGLKRGPCDRQEEMAVAKRKKVDAIRNLTKEKKVTKKIDEPPARDVKQPAAAILKKPGPDLIKKTEQRAAGPTMLMIKFLKGGCLPSFSELKARFAHYGPMDHSGTHIFWNTFSCQVVFRHKAHAEEAHKFVVGSSSLFGNTVLKCSLKEVGIVGSAEPEPPVKVSKEDHQQPEMEDRSPSMIPARSGVEPKSILWKSGGEEAAGNGGRGHVKFMLGGQGQMKSQMKNKMENKTSHLTMDFSNKNFEKAVDPSVVTGPSPPPPMHYGTTRLAPPSLPPRCMQMTPLDRPMNAHLMTQNKDVAQQMLSLLIRCNDVVMNVCSILGYTPYHPL